MLHIFSLYMKGSSPNLAEIIKENLKNILLVMSMSGIFHPNTSNSPRLSQKVEKEEGKVEGVEQKEYLEEDIWNMSWNIIDLFCPSLKEDLNAEQNVNNNVNVPSLNSVEKENEPKEKTVQ